MRLFTLLAAFAALAASSATLAAGAIDQKPIRAAIGEKLKDPYSAVLSDMVRRTAPNAKGVPTDVVCGLVNAKNSFGGYVGPRPFIYFISQREAHIVDVSAGPNDLDRMIYQNFCGATR
ncbi:hypothetical protein [Rhodoplanes serenus]|uniref:hypothetical protein n=1 Tax=Rhodoplanes serenus TaxID=200615 RepID=UPI000DAE78CF|nr:hypothetical protein [Rhodoplanes serenus]RAI34523.1 hypothetical protein CH340_08835 [Rhodoplanes serenus]